MRYLFEFHSAQDLKALKAEAALPCNLDAVACGWITEPLPVSLLERRACVAHASMLRRAAVLGR